MHLQPTLSGALVKIRPLQSTDFEELFKVGSDPMIWEQHPQSDRYKKEIFQKYFQGATDSNGAVIIEDQSGKIIGASRYYDYKFELSQVKIGYTFYSRSVWGGLYNREIKKLMLSHAFNFVNTVLFEVGAENLRSRRAMEKIGGRLIGENILDNKKHVIFEINKTDSF